MTEGNPLEIEDPEFSCHAPHEYSLEAKLDISDPNSGYKSDRYSTLTFRGDQMGAYPMKVALRIDGNKEWFRQDEVNEICIQFAGDYEAETLKNFFQHVGLMMLPVYGDTVQAVDDIVYGRKP
jgi:hypothetical protein